MNAVRLVGSIQSQVWHFCPEFPEACHALGHFTASYWSQSWVLPFCAAPLPSRFYLEWNVFCFWASLLKSGLQMLRSQLWLSLQEAGCKYPVSSMLCRAYIQALPGRLRLYSGLQVTEFKEFLFQILP